MVESNSRVTYSWEGRGGRYELTQKTEVNCDPTKINNEGSSIYFFKNNITLSKLCSRKKTFKVETVGA